jgi:hypothetical protein
MESFRLERSVEGDLHIEQEETNQNSNQNIELASEAPESAINMVSVTPSSPQEDMMQESTATPTWCSSTTLKAYGF